MNEWINQALLLQFYILYNKITSKIQKIIQAFNEQHLKANFHLPPWSYRDKDMDKLQV